MEKDEDLFCYAIPSLTNENFGIDLNYKRYVEEKARLEVFPSDYTLAVLADLAYKDSITMPEGLEDWEVLTYASNKRITNGYRGVAFFNPKMCHVVIAHRGTDVKNPGAVINDIKLALKLFKHPQAQSAASFAYLVAEEIKRVNKEKDYEKLPFRLTITGHSLGAWLAQYTTFTVKYLTLNEDKTKFIRDDNYLSNIHPHTVVFESPGCREIFDKLVKKLVHQYTYRKYGNYHTLDMTVYLNAPNWINCVNTQIGTIYMLPINGHSIKDIKSYLEATKGKVEKKVVLDMQSGITSSIFQGIKCMVRSKAEGKLKTVPAEDDICSLNVFTESEVEFVNDYYRVNLKDSASIENFRVEYDIPKFKLIYEYNLLKGEDFKKVILIVKNLHPDKQIIFKMLQDDVGHQVRFNLFKNDVETFEENLLNFKCYYFKDKYGFLDFFKSDKKILNVSVLDKSDDESDDDIKPDFETNIIRNIITYYKNKPNFEFSDKKIAFIDWNKLSKFIKESADIINNNYDLVVVEYYFDDENNFFLEFLRNVKIKVIILTTKKMSNLKDSVDNIVEVSGFGSKLTFGDLNDESQEIFLNKQIFKLNNQSISLNGLVKNISNGNENLMNNFPMASALELIKAHELNAIVLDCHMSNLLKAVLFYDLYDEINCKQELHNLDNSRVFVLREDGTTVNLSKVLLNVKDPKYIESNEEYQQQCFDNTAQTKYLITTKKGNIFLTSIFNYDFYIHRSIIHKRSVNPNIFKNTTDLLDYYIFYGNDKIFNERFPSQQEDRFKFAVSEDEAVEMAKSSKSKNHVFKINIDGTIDWRRSYGNINTLHKYMQNKEISIKECDIMNDDQIIIISGEPGIGKSSVIEYLYLTLKSKYWIFPIQLKNCCFDGMSDELTYDEVAKFIIKNCSYETKSIQHILSFCLQYESKVPIYLMLDSFDEIVEEDFKNKVIDVVNFLKLESKVKILITTRPHLCKQLENDISVFSSHFKKLNYKNQIVAFLVEFWRSHLCLFSTCVDKDHLESIAENMLTSAQNTIGESVSSFIEIPMHMRILAETVTPKTYITSQFSDVLTLYHKYIKQRCDIYFRRFSLDPHPTVKQWLIESILGKISALSINKLSNVNIQQFTGEEMEEFYKVGLIYLDSNNLNYKFLHDSVCDYFMSDSITQWLTSQMYILFVEYDVAKFLITDLFLDEELKKVRLFLNFHLQTVEITPNRIELCKTKLTEICRDKSLDKSLLFNGEKESIFHTCINENLIYLLKYFLLELLDSSSAKRILTESNVKLETPLYYAISKTSQDDNPNHAVNCLTIFLNFLNNLESTIVVKEIFLATLFNYFISDEDLVKLNRYIKNFETLETVMNEINEKIPLIEKYLNASKKNDSQTLTQILAELNDEMIKTYLLKSTNKFKETGIHLTSDINIAKILVKPFNIDLQDHHGMTPLCRSIKEKRVDIAKMLIEKGASYVADSFGVTPLIHASKYNLKDIVKIIFISKGKRVVAVDERNLFGITSLMISARHGNQEIVTCLIDRKADIHLRDGNGLTAFYHAVKGRHTPIVRFLKEKGSDINTRDKHGTTPLFYSVKHQNFDMIHCLLSHGANVNIGNIYGQYPLQRLIKENLKSPRSKETDSYIKMFLSGGEFTAPAETHMLSEEEHWYIQKLLNLQDNRP